MDHFRLAKDDQLVMEKSPSYMFKEDAPIQIKEFNPNMSIIFSFRDPFERTISDYLEVTQRNVDPLELPPVHEHLMSGEAGSLLDSSNLITESLYDVHLERWLKVFDRSQILVSD